MWDRLFDLVSSLATTFWIACKRSRADILSEEKSTLQLSMQDEIKACISITSSTVETTDISLLIFLKWSKQDLVSCLTWVSNNEVGVGSRGKRPHTLHYHEGNLFWSNHQELCLISTELQRIICHPVPNSVNTDNLKASLDLNCKWSWISSTNKWYAILNLFMICPRGRKYSENSKGPEPSPAGHHKTVERGQTKSPIDDPIDLPIWKPN